MDIFRRIVGNFTQWYPTDCYYNYLEHFKLQYSKQLFASLQVGSLRYMAPEALEGHINLNDVVAQLKQIDIYALGIVLWEISTRCQDICKGKMNF